MLSTILKECVVLEKLRERAGGKPCDYRLKKSALEEYCHDIIPGRRSSIFDFSQLVEEDDPIELIHLKSSTSETGLQLIQRARDVLYQSLLNDDDDESVKVVFSHSAFISVMLAVLGIGAREPQAKYNRWLENAETFVIELKDQASLKQRLITPQTPGPPLLTGLNPLLTETASLPEHTTLLTFSAAESLLALMTRNKFSHQQGTVLGVTYEGELVNDQENMLALCKLCKFWNGNRKHQCEGLTTPSWVMCGHPWVYQDQSRYIPIHVEEIGRFATSNVILIVGFINQTDDEMVPMSQLPIDHNLPHYVNKDLHHKITQLAQNLALTLGSTRIDCIYLNAP